MISPRKYTFPPFFLETITKKKHQTKQPLPKTIISVFGPIHLLLLVDNFNPHFNRNHNILLPHSIRLDRAKNILLNKQTKKRFEILCFPSPFHHNNIMMNNNSNNNNMMTDSSHSSGTTTNNNMTGSHHHQNNSVSSSTDSNEEQGLNMGQDNNKQYSTIACLLCR